jgi:hypothetical protein
MVTKENANLLPCPFCGGKAVITKNKEYWTAGCGTPGCWFEGGYSYESIIEENVVHMWNKRPKSRLRRLWETLNGIISGN